MMQILMFLVVGLLWGGTNPWLKLAAQRQVPPQSLLMLPKSLRQTVYLLTDYHYLLPLLLNLSGSILYYKTLRDYGKILYKITVKDIVIVLVTMQVDLKMAVPIANSLTFIFTHLMGYAIGEPFGSYKTMLGISLVIAGVAVCLRNS
ncbi:hypothetical protein MIR68_007483 [Amoeboaphelidium protococcarum]|nr:hypothetical protein MIR68_007483 [Amoeboaphelidium protococcarum]KAI3642010.1 hypothetical protein MP228_011565 [Amoeboaphelidium protococcarum]